LLLLPQSTQALPRGPSCRTHRAWSASAFADLIMTSNPTICHEGVLCFAGSSESQESVVCVPNSALFSVFPAALSPQGAGWGKGWDLSVRLSTYPDIWAIYLPPACKLPALNQTPHVNELLQVCPLVHPGHQINFQPCCGHKEPLLPPQKSLRVTLSPILPLSVSGISIFFATQGFSGS
jgi:hypothetical protein